MLWAVMSLLFQFKARSKLGGCIAIEMSPKLICVIFQDVVLS